MAIFRCAAIILLCFASLIQAESGSELLAEAEELVQTGLYLEAFKALDDMDPADKENRQQALKMRGDILSYYLDKYEEALAEYDQAMLVNEESAVAGECHFKKAMILFELGKMDESAREFTIYVKNFPGGKQVPTATFMIEDVHRLKQSGEKPKAKETPKLSTYKIIRVALQRQERQAALGSTGSFTLMGKSGTRRENMANARFQIQSGKIRNSETGRVEEEWLLKPQNGFLTFQGKRYRGTIRLKEISGKLLVINRLDLEEYLLGVVPSEMPAGWPAEALKSQAVAARTYALFHCSKRGSEAFDVVPTIYDQVYTGVDGEHASTTKAVQATAGQVLIYNGRPVVAYFSSANGGYTETAGNVWGVDFAYLKSHPDEYDPRGYKGWKVSYPLNEVQSKLSKVGSGMGTLQNLFVESKTKAGRVKQMALVYSGGTKRISGDKFRKYMGRSKFISWAYEPKLSTGTVTFYGKGFGHAVGLSQHGAKVRAENGQSFHQILDFYYPGADLVSVTAKR